MKITKSQLKWIIKEELARITNEGSAGDPIFPTPPGEEPDPDPEDVERLLGALEEFARNLTMLANQFAEPLGLSPEAAYSTLVDFLAAAAPPGEPQVDFESPDVAVAENKGGR